DGRVRAAELIGDVYPLHDWAEAFARFERRDSVKLLLDPTG
ncbi:MAG: sorbitol dehydrogenase, partial [Thermomicrobiales bacterium]|nr:sorbitol dehydrogenase [Thermomicrobiales bacterium]